MSERAAQMTFGYFELRNLSSLAYPDEQPRLVVHYLKEDHEDVMPTPQPEPVRQELDGIFRRIDREHFDATPDRRKCRLCPVRPACAERR